MECYQCLQDGVTREAAGLCHHCSAALCADHTCVTFSKRPWIRTFWPRMWRHAQKYARICGKRIRRRSPGISCAWRSNSSIKAIAFLLNWTSPTHFDPANCLRCGGRASSVETLVCSSGDGVQRQDPALQENEEESGAGSSAVGAGVRSPCLKSKESGFVSGRFHLCEPDWRLSRHRQLPQARAEQAGRHSESAGPDVSGHPSDHRSPEPDQGARESHSGHDAAFSPRNDNRCVPADHAGGRRGQGVLHSRRASKAEHAAAETSRIAENLRAKSWRRSVWKNAKLASNLNHTRQGYESLSC